MADALLQTLTIKLNAEVGNTKRKLKDVATSVESLEEIGKKADWSVFEQIRTNLEGIAKIDFSNVADSLKDVVTAMKALGISAKQVKNMPAISSPQMENVLSGENIEEPSWNLKDTIVPFASLLSSELQSANAQFSTLTKQTSEYATVIDVLKDRLKDAGFSLNQISYVMGEWRNLEAPVANFDELLDILKELGFSANQVNEILANIGKSNGFGNWEESLRQCGLTANEVGIVIKDLFESQREPVDFERLKDVLISLGFSADEAEVTMAKLGKATKKAGKDAEHGAKGFKKMLNSIKRITFYRMVRRAIQLIGQSITEGIQNMALFDSDFNTSMSNIMSSLSYFKNSLGALLAPIIQALEPFITMLVDGLADVSNLIGEIFAKMQGKDQFAKAIKGAEDYAESLKKIKSVSLGIDELNVIQQDEQADKFETVNIEPSEVASELSEIKDNFIATFQKIGENIKKILKTAIEPLLNLLKPIMNILDVVLSIVGEIVDLAVSLVEPIIAPLVNFIGNIVQFVADILYALKPIITGVSQTLKPIIELISYSVGIILNLLNEIMPITQIITTAIKVMVVPLTTVFAILTTIFETLKGVYKTFVKLFTFDWGGIEDVWKDVGNNIKNAWQNVKDSTVGLDVQFPAKADGGFVEDGFFFANHTELIGQFSNGKTAVANNEQITEGIYRAVRQALTEGVNTGEVNRDIIIKIDGREIGRASEKYQKQLGAKIFSGGSGYGN